MVMARAAAVVHAEVKTRSVGRLPRTPRRCVEVQAFGFRLTKD